MVSSLTGTERRGNPPSAGLLQENQDAGVLVGYPPFPRIKHVIEEDWDVDFFMCCVYERHRTREELLALLGHVPSHSRGLLRKRSPGCLP